MRTNITIILCTLVTLLFVSTISHASVNTELTAKSSSQRNYSVTVNPFPLVLSVFPVLILSTEYNIQHKMSVVGILGGGIPALHSLSGGVGAQIRRSLWGDFSHNIFLGVGANYNFLRNGDVKFLQYRKHTVGLSLFTGYKIIFDIGLTMGIYLGAQYAMLWGNIVDSDGPGDYSSSRGVIPYGDIALGWSF